MNQIENIRKNVFGISQSELAEIAGTTQPSVSRWENGEQEPSQGEMARIREAALARSLPWNDGLFFETPAEPEPERVAS